MTEADPQSCRPGRSLEAPTVAHPFGFSVFGCDYLAETLGAARTSRTIAALTDVGTVFIALVLGSGAGFYGGWTGVVAAAGTEPPLAGAAPHSLPPSASCWS